MRDPAHRRDGEWMKLDARAGVDTRHGGGKGEKDRKRYLDSMM